MLARVFPRRTHATPDDDYAFVGDPGLFVPNDIDEVHISVAFTYDLPKAEKLAKSWKSIASVKIGGPATGMRGEEFVPGKYVKKGYVITSRGCPNRCWFCSVWKREGNIRELPIHDGWNILDDNLLACSERHIRSVFDMLKRQKERAQFTGGLEAKRLQAWHVDLLCDLRPQRIFFAYDTSDDYEPLLEAGKLLHEKGIKSGSKSRGCYVLVGYSNDSFEEAEKRLWQTVDAGFWPMAMLYRDEQGKTSHEWRKFQRLWARPAIIYHQMKRRERGE